MAPFITTCPREFKTSIVAVDLIPVNPSVRPFKTALTVDVLRVTLMSSGGVGMPHFSGHVPSFGPTAQILNS